jgi:hypothetical protein
MPIRKFPLPVPFTELAAELPPDESNTPNTRFTEIASVRLPLTGGGGTIADVVAVKYNRRYFKFANVERKSMTCSTCEFINYHQKSQKQRPAQYPYLKGTLHNQIGVDLPPTHIMEI